MITAGGSHPVIPETPIAVYVKLIALLIVSEIIQILNSEHVKQLPFANMFFSFYKRLHLFHANLLLLIFARLQLNI